MENKLDYLAPPQKRSQTPHIHHLHVRVPIGLWKRFRRSFPEQGEVARVMLLALEMYLDAYEARHGEANG